MSKLTQDIAFSAEIQTELFSLTICFDKNSRNFAHKEVLYREQNAYTTFGKFPVVMFQVNI